MTASEAELSPREKAQLEEAVRQRNERLGQRLFYALFPDEDRVWLGPPLQKGLIATGQTLHSRHKYPKHMEHFAAGAEWIERCAMMANRVGKTLSLGGYETACHLTGLYPPWWRGRRFNHPVSAWAAGKTYQTTRDIVQLTLLGETAWAPLRKGSRAKRKVMDGRGIIPGEMLGPLTWHQGVADLVDTIRIKHVSGGWSDLGLKSYDQGRGSFEGTGKHWIWLDEEPGMPVYGECLIRTATVGGLIVLTFTPLEGMSEVVLQFLPREMRPGLESEK